jgi:hypothetical protein
MSASRTDSSCGEFDVEIVVSTDTSLPCDVCSLPGGVPARRVAGLVFWAIVGGQEVLRRKVSLRCAPKPVRTLMPCRRKNQLL